MRLKKLMALGMASVMTLSLAACGNSADTASTDTTSTQPAEQEKTETTVQEEKTEPAAQEQTGELSYMGVALGENTDLTANIKWIHHKTDREEDGTIASMIAEFNKEYPNITVTTEAVTNYAEDALLRLSTGDWGDIMFIPAVDKNQLSTYFVPLGKTEELAQKLNFANQWEFDKVAYGVPYMANAQGVLYNKAVFEKAGITELPTTPEEFVADLQLIKDNTDAIPLYTNYAAGWTMGAWDAYIGCVSNGDDTYMNQKFVHTEDPFVNNGDGTGIYGLYSILYNAVEKGLIEDDYTTTDWEGCKGMLNRGEIGTMVLGSWAYAQMVEADTHGEDVGYMPFPITVNGTQYALAGGDYCYGINVNSSDENKLASMIFVKWMVEKSNWCFNEGGYSVVKGGANPDMYAAFDGCEVLSDQPSLEGEETFLNDMNSESELSFNAGGNDKVQKIIEHAANGDKSFDDIMAEWKQAWNDAQEELGIEVLY